MGVRARGMSFASLSAAAAVLPRSLTERVATKRAQGVSKDSKQREPALAKVRAELEEHGFETRSEVDSALLGPKGNRALHVVWASRPNVLSCVYGGPTRHSSEKLRM